jgi:hypothetical protein
MTATATSTSAPRTFDPDHYLDCRQPGWEIYEDRGLIRFERPTGSANALVFVDADCVEVLHTLGIAGGHRIAAKR